MLSDFASLTFGFFINHLVNSNHFKFIKSFKTYVYIRVEIKNVFISDGLKLSTRLKPTLLQAIHAVFLPLTSPAWLNVQLTSFMFNAKAGLKGGVGRK